MTLPKNFLPYLFAFFILLFFRLPSFHRGFFGFDEALYAVHGEKIAEGGVQYLNSWESRPPVIIELFGWMGKIFGIYNFLPIKIFTLLYIFLTGIVLNKFLTSIRLIGDKNFIPLISYCILCSVPWHAQELNGEILLNLPLIFSFIFLWRSSKNEKKIFLYSLIAGFLFFTALMIKFSAVGFFITIGASIFLFHEKLFLRTIGMITGILVGVIFLFIGLMYKNNLVAFIDIAVLYAIDYLRIGVNPSEKINAWRELAGIMKTWLLFFISGVTGIFFFIKRKEKYLLPRLKYLLVFWMASEFVFLFLFGRRMYLHYFIEIAPALSLGGAVFYERLKKVWQKMLMGTLSLTPSIFLLIIYFAVCTDAQYRRFGKYFKSDGWAHEMYIWMNHHYEPLNEVEEILNISLAKNDRVLILSFHPDWYVYLHRTCATKYTNFSIAYYKMPFLQENSKSLVSRTETPTLFIREFLSDMPQALVDPDNHFEKLFNLFPEVFSQYRRVRCAIPLYILTHDLRAELKKSL